jgi:hypothetical protein
MFQAGELRFVFQNSSALFISELSDVDQKIRPETTADVRTRGQAPWKMRGLPQEPLHHPWFAGLRATALVGGGWHGIGNETAHRDMIRVPVCAVRIKTDYNLRPDRSNYADNVGSRFLKVREM